MELGQSPEIAAKPPSQNIFSAVERVGAAARHGREKVAEKIRGAKIGALGLAVGSAFFLAACGGEAQSSQSIAALPPTPPDPEMQVSPDGSIRPYYEKGEPLKQDVDTLVSSVKSLLNEDYFKSMGWDFDQIAAHLKGLGDKRLEKFSLKIPADSTKSIQTAGLTRDGYRPLQFTDDLPFGADVVLDTNTGRVQRAGVRFYVDKTGKPVAYKDDFPYAPETAEDFDALLNKLEGAIKMPAGSKPGSTLKDLDWKYSASEKEFSRRADIDDNGQHSVIFLNGVAGNGLNLVTISTFAHTGPVLHSGPNA